MTSVSAFLIAVFGLQRQQRFGAQQIRACLFDFLSEFGAHFLERQTIAVQRPLVFGLQRRGVALCFLQQRVAGVAVGRRLVEFLGNALQQVLLQLVLFGQQSARRLRPAPECQSVEPRPAPMKHRARP